MSNDRLEPFNYHNIAFKSCTDVISLGRLDRLWFFRHHLFMKIGLLGKKWGFKAPTCWTELLAFWGVWNRSGIIIFPLDRLFSGFLEPWSGCCVTHKNDCSPLLSFQVMPLWLIFFQNSCTRHNSVTVKVTSCNFTGICIRSSRCVMHNNDYSPFLISQVMPLWLFFSKYF